MTENHPAQPGGVWSDGGSSPLEDLRAGLEAFRELADQPYRAEPIYLTGTAYRQYRDYLDQLDADRQNQLNILGRIVE